MPLAIRSRFWAGMDGIGTDKTRYTIRTQCQLRRRVCFTIRTQFLAVGMPLAIRSQFWAPLKARGNLLRTQDAKNAALSWLLVGRRPIPDRDGRGSAWIKSVIQFEPNLGFCCLAASTGCQSGCQSAAGFVPASHKICGLQFESAMRRASPTPMKSGARSGCFAAWSG